MENKLVIKPKSGIEISKIFYENYVKQSFKEKIPYLFKKMAIGLIGEGSECYGYDDEISQDHDFGIRLIVWIPKELINQATIIKNIMDNMAIKYKSDLGINYDLGKREVIEINSFYAHFTGLFRNPKTNIEWINIPIENLSIVTNGEVFEDRLGKFTGIQEYLKKNYPEDVRFKKISYHLAMAAQAGQYNYPRALERKDYVTCRLLQSRFIENVLVVICLLNSNFPPFFKWIYKASSEGSELGNIISNHIKNLILLDQEKYGSKCIILIEEISWIISNYLRITNMSKAEDNYLLNHANEIISKINDEKIKNMNIWIDKEKSI